MNINESRDLDKPFRSVLLERTTREFVAAVGPILGDMAQDPHDIFVSTDELETLTQAFEKLKAALPPSTERDS